jgi:hypothetical protein
MQSHSITADLCNCLLDNYGAVDYELHQQLKLLVQFSQTIHHAFPMDQEPRLINACGSLHSKLDQPFKDLDFESRNYIQQLFKTLAEQSGQKCADIYTKKYYFFLIKDILQSKQVSFALGNISLFLTVAGKHNPQSEQEIDLACHMTSLALRFLVSLTDDQQAEIEHTYFLSSQAPLSRLALEENRSSYQKIKQIFSTFLLPGQTKEPKLENIKLLPNDQPFLTSREGVKGVICMQDPSSLLLEKTPFQINPVTKTKIEQFEELDFYSLEELEKDEKMRKQAFLIVREHQSKVLCELWKKITSHYLPLLIPLLKESNIDVMNEHFAKNFDLSFLPLIQKLFFGLSSSFSKSEEFLLISVLNQIAIFFQNLTSLPCHLSESDLYNQLHEELLALFKVLLIPPTEREGLNLNTNAFVPFLLAPLATQVLTQLITPFNLCQLIDRLLKSIPDLIQHLEEIKSYDYLANHPSQTPENKVKLNQFIQTIIQTPALKAFFVSPATKVELGETIQIIVHSLIELANSPSTTFLPNLTFLPSLLKIALNKEKETAAEKVIQLCQMIKNSQVSLIPTLFLYHLVFQKADPDQSQNPAYIPAFPNQELQEEKSKKHFQEDLYTQLLTKMLPSLLTNIQVAIKP